MVGIEVVVLLEQLPPHVSYTRPRRVSDLAGFSDASQKRSSSPKRFCEASLTGHGLRGCVSESSSGKEPPTPRRKSLLRPSAEMGLPVSSPNRAWSCSGPVRNAGPLGVRLGPGRRQGQRHVLDPVVVARGGGAGEGAPHGQRRGQGRHSGPAEVAQRSGGETTTYSRQISGRSS